MDRKQLITAVVLSIAVFWLWMLWKSNYEKNHPEPSAQEATSTPAATPPGSATTKPGNPTSQSSTQSSTSQPAGPVLTSALHVLKPVLSAASTPLIIGSSKKDDGAYSLQIQLSERGAAVSEVTLNKYEAPRKNPRDKSSPPYTFESAYSDHPETASLASRLITIPTLDANPLDLLTAKWTNGPSKAGSASYYVIIGYDDEHPVAKVTKTFTIVADPLAKGYEVEVTQTIENLSDKSFDVSALINGTTAPPAELEQGTDRFVVVGYAEPGTKAVVSPAHQFTPLDYKPDIAADASPKALTTDGAKRFVWVGQASTYFAAIILPDISVNAAIKVSAEPKDPKAEVDRKIALTLAVETKTLGPKGSANASFAVPLKVFFGPKWRDVIADSYYVGWPHQYEVLLAAQSQTCMPSMCSWVCSMCSWPWLISGLVWLLGRFHSVFRDWGLAIVCLVILVRILLHPITKRAQVQMMKMGKLAPEVEKLKKKYVDQPDVLNKEMMKLYREQGGAILGCLPMFLQTPIWIALWTALQGTFELRQAPLFYGWTWIQDLSKPDSLVHFSGPVKVLFFTMYGINILPLVMAAVTYINQKYFMPTPIAATPEQMQQQKIQRLMSLVFPLMFYTLPSGLNLYYVTSMSLGIFESKIIRDHIKEQEELAKLRGPELVTTKRSRTSRPGDDKDEKPAKVGWFDRIMLAMQKAQERAEQMKNEKKKGKGK